MVFISNNNFMYVSSERSYLFLLSIYNNNNNILPPFITVLFYLAINKIWKI